MKLPKRITQKLLYESANIICWFRIVASIILALSRNNVVYLAILCSMAFISDALDGYCYRRFARSKPYQHWFNRLPITLDPIADFCFVAGGIIHAFSNKLAAVIFVAILACLMMAWSALGLIATGRTYAILMTALTYDWFEMMILALVMVWASCTAVTWQAIAGAGITLGVFYAVWLPTRDKSRTVRRKG